MNETIIVGLSGGVDSSVAALRLLEQGYRVEGLFMKNWEEDDSEDYCSAAEDLADAQAVADKLDIRLHTVNFSAEYWDRVFTIFLDEYAAGRTPNPDILCNREIKFRAFLEHALELGASRIATGHYARNGRDDGRELLLKGLDAGKDQTYFLYTLGQAQLENTLFPIGDLPKKAVREIARTNGLVTHDKRDSTGICFIGERDFRTFLSRYLPAQPGAVETDDGRVVGEHQGLMYYTLGQRQGLGIGGIPGAREEPWYVVQKDLSRNVLVIGQGHDHPLLMSGSLRASQLHWVAGEPPSSQRPLAAKTRYRQTEEPCQIVHLDETGCRVEFDRPQWAVTPGQSVVFYDGDRCLGGGVIDTVE